jgi:hypothetical protein
MLEMWFPCYLECARERFANVGYPWQCTSHGRFCRANFLLLTEPRTMRMVRPSMWPAKCQTWHRAEEQHVTGVPPA